MILKILISIIILFLLILIISHYISLHRIEDDVNITQITDPYYSKLNKAQLNNTPVVVQQFSESPNVNLSLLKTNKFKANMSKDCTYLESEIKKDNIDTLTKSYLDNGNGIFNLDITNTDVISKKYKAYLSKFTSPITIKNSIVLHLLPKTFTRGLGRCYKNCNLYIVQSGEVKFQLFHPKYEKLLLKKKYKHGNIDGWTVSNGVKDKPKYIDVIIREGQGIIIPFKWIYNYTTSEKSVILNYSTLDLLSPILFGLEQLKYNVS